jgi:two-component system NarL family sensor kinase
MEKDRSGKLGWALCFATFAALAAVVPLAIANDSASPRPELAVEWVSVPFLAVFCAFSLAGALILAGHQRHPVGWLLCAFGLMMMLSVLGAIYAQRALIADPGSLPGGQGVAWVAELLSVPSLLGLVTFGLLLFPDGHLPGRRWRALAWITGVSIAMATVAVALRPGEFEAATGIENPLGVDGLDIFDIGWIAIPFCAFACAASLIARYRTAGDLERQQIRWVAAAGCLLALAICAGSVTWWIQGGETVWGTVLLAVGLAGTLAAITIAILRYRLYDLDLVVNRTLVYGLLTALVVLGYVGLVTALGALLDSSGIGVSLAATAAVAVAIQPLRLVIQRRIDRLMYGDRDDPYRALARLGARLGQTLDPDAVLPAITEAVAEGLRLPYAAIELEEGGKYQVAASQGEPPGGEFVRLPLEYRGEAMGRLVVSPRGPSEPLTRADLRLLADLARQAGVAAHGVRLTQDLRSSRERLVTAREEERRRLRRDLHDGLGPALAGIALELGAARGLIERDPDAVRAQLLKLRDAVQEAIADIRRIAYDLRPPTLDEFGLVAAVREQAARLGAANNDLPANGLRVAIETPAQLPPLPAAVEVAAYRIALEAITNVARHADATSCLVRIAANGELELEVSDDGRGTNGSGTKGLGLVSMRERAEELGGSLTVGAGTGGRGTVVTATLPLGAK